MKGTYRTAYTADKIAGATMKVNKADEKLRKTIDSRIRRETNIELTYDDVLALVDNAIEFLKRNGYGLDEVYFGRSDPGWLSWRRHVHDEWRPIVTEQVSRGAILGRNVYNDEERDDDLEPESEKHLTSYSIIVVPTSAALRSRVIEWRPAFLLPEDTMARCAKLRKKHKPAKPRHRVRMESEQEELERRGLEPISPVTPYKVGKRTQFEGDRPLVAMTDAIRSAASQLDLGRRQIDNALYLFHKSRKLAVKNVDYQVLSRALLFQAGREMHLGQRIGKFIPEGRNRLFLKYLRELGYVPRKHSEVAVMARVNEILTGHEMAPLSQAQVHHALEKLPGQTKSPEAWVIVYAFATTDLWKKGYGHALSQGELASETGMSLKHVGDMYDKAKNLQPGVIQERKRVEKYLAVKEKRQQQKLDEELIHKCDWKIKRLGIVHRFTPAQVRDALERKPPAVRERLWLWVIAYYLVTSGAVPKRNDKPISDTATAHLIKIPYSTFKKYESMARLARQSPT